MADRSEVVAIAAGSPQRLLAISGMLLIIAGMIFGDIFAVFILHPNNANIGQELYLAAQAVASGQPGVVFEHFGQIGVYLEKPRHQGRHAQPHYSVWIPGPDAGPDPALGCHGGETKAWASEALCGRRNNAAPLRVRNSLCRPCL